MTTHPGTAGIRPSFRVQLRFDLAYFWSCFAIACSLLILLSQLRPIMVVAVGIMGLVYVLLTKPVISKWFWALSICGLGAVVCGVFVTEEFWAVNNLLSLYIIGGVLLLWFAIPSRGVSRHSLFRWTIGCFTVGLLINDLLGLVQWIVLTTDDRFKGLYGAHGIGVHGLMLLNSIATLYYLVLCTHQPNRRNFLLLLIFSTSSVLAGFGTGIMCLTACLLLGLLMNRNRRLAVISLGLIMYCAIVQISFDSFNAGYYKANLARAQHIKSWKQDETASIHPKIDNQQQTLSDAPPSAVVVKARLQAAEDLSAFSVDQLDAVKLPRKYIALHTYVNLVLHEPKFLLGMGPGTYSSRVSFLLNGDYNQNPLVRELGPQIPTLAAQYVYPLWWNNGILKRSYADGTRNQPFSQALSFISEYGVLFSLLLLAAFWFWGRRYFRDLKQAGDGFLVSRQFSVFLLVFAACLLAVENMMEYTEFLVILLLVKVMHTDAVARLTQPAAQDADESTDPKDQHSVDSEVASATEVLRVPEHVLEVA